STEARVDDDVLITLDQASPRERFVEYMRLSVHNGLFYGLMRTDVARQIYLFPHLGGDLTATAATCLRGKVATLRDVRIHRARSGASDRESVNRYLRLPSDILVDWCHPIYVARGAVSAIRRGEGTFSRFSRRERARLARDAGCSLLLGHYRKLGGVRLL